VQLRWSLNEDMKVANDTSISKDNWCNYAPSSVANVCFSSPETVHYLWRPIPHSLIVECFDAARVLANETREALLRRIDRRQRRVWKSLRRYWSNSPALSLRHIEMPRTDMPIVHWPGAPGLFPHIGNLTPWLTRLSSRS
jgi:hypothetical protein